MISPIRFVFPYFAAAACAVGACVAVAACDEQETLPNGHLVRAAAAAKQQGKSAATIDYFEENARRTSSLAQALKQDSYMTGVATATQQVEVVADEIRTWFVFDRVRHVAGVTTQSARCGIVPPATLKVGARQTAVPLRIGAADVNGVRLTMQGPHSQITVRPGQEYLLVGESCAGSVLRPTHGEFSIFNVDSSGNIRPVVTSNPKQPADLALVELGTIDRLRAAGDGKDE